MSWLLIVGTAWMGLAVPLALLLGRSIRVADQLHADQFPLSLPDVVPQDWTISPAQPH